METLGDMKRRFVHLFQVLDTRFLLLIVLVEHLFQGFVFGGGAGGLIGIPIMYMLRSYGTLSAPRMQVLSTIAVSPWSLKPFIGMLSDTLYIGGYNKLPYILLTVILSIVSCFFLVFSWPITPISLTFVLFAMFLQISTADLLIEARYTQYTNMNPEISPDLMSFIHIPSTVFQILSIVLTGILITYVPIHYIYLIPMPGLVLLLYPIYYNWMGEESYDEGSSSLKKNSLTNMTFNLFWYETQRVTNVPIIGLDTKKIRDQWRIFILGVVITVVSLLTSIVGLFDIPPIYLFILSVTGAPVMIAAFFFFIDTSIAKVQTFTIIQNMFALSLESATFFFYTDGPEQYPEGPHFSNFFYVTVMGIVGTCFALVGLITYNMFMTKWTYRKVLLVTNLLSIVTSIPNIFFFLRWNRLIGIPDTLFVIGGESLQVVTAVWSSFPLSIIMLQLCPDGMNATVYALLAGCSNLGNSLARYQGAFVLDLLNIKPSGAIGESQQFDNLWIAVSISVLLPLVPIIFIFILIPNVSQTDKIDDVN